MKHYEVLFILKPTLTEEEVNAKLEFVKEVLVKNGAEIETVVPMGTRKLAYKIKKYERGTYFVIYFKAPTNLIAELERILRITEEVIRFLIVKYDNPRLKGLFRDPATLTRVYVGNHALNKTT